MPLWTPSSGFESFIVDNWGTNPSINLGTSVIPGASNAEGAWTQLLTALAQDVDGFMVKVSQGGTSTAAKPHLLDLGIDPAGGTAYTAKISNIVCGSSGSGGGSPAHSFFFPLRLPSGATVAARVQGSNATAGTVRIAIRCRGQAKRPWLLPVGQYTETLGTITGSSGVTFTPGNAADGAWVSLGTTTRHLWWWQLAYQVNNATITAENTYVELGYGTTGNQRVIQRRIHTGTTAELSGDQGHAPQLTWLESYCPLPPSTELWVRGRCQDAPDTGYSAVAIGVGG